MRWIIDPAHTVVAFSAKHLGLTTVHGRFTRFEGELDIDDGANPSSASGRVDIETDSIDTGNADRDAHLRSPDFLDVENHPKMTVEARSIEPAGDDRFRVTVDLTIRGITRPVTLDYEHAGIVTDPFGNTKAGGRLSGTINRLDWGLTWNVPLGGGGLLVSENVRIEVDGEVAQSAEEIHDEANAEMTETA
jgi:polyisoprenoid-binding protein YceI